ncbi:MAG: C39 family peptidase, partial [Thermoplasmata archaeon]|nr:C39 family peptidase [Thermoplasmata archaeon]
MRSHRLNHYLAFAIVLAFALQVLPVEWERGEALSNSVTLDVPYHMEVNSGYSGEAALEMLFDYWGEDIPQQEIRNVTGDVVDAAEPEDLLRAAHFSSESRAKLNPTQMGYSERMFGYGYAAFHYNWGREGVSTSPRFNQRFDDLRSVLDEGYPIILYMRESAANPLKKTYRVLIGYDLTTNEFILHDPLPQGTGDLGGESVRVSPADLDRLWNVSGGMRWGMIAVAWQFDLHYPLQVDAGEEFTVEVDVNYPCPDPFPKNQYPISGQIRIELQMNENFTLLSQSWEEGIRMGGDWGKAFLNIKAPDRGMDQIYTIYVGVGGEISGTTAAGRSYKDIIGGSTSFAIKVKGYVNHAPEISRAWIAPQEVLRDGESQITLYCSAEDVDGDLVGVEVDLQRLGGYTHQRLYDDGTHGDETPGDGVYSLLYTVPRGAEEGNITVTFTAFDAAGATATATASVEVKDPYTSTSPPVIVRTGFTPSAAPPDGYTEVRIWARVMDPEGDIDRVYADMTPIGGKKITILRDDGAGGDLIPADGNYTYLFTIPPTIAYGVYNITVKAEDVPGHVTKRTAILTVIPPPEPPKLSQVKLNRTSVPNDGVTPVLLTARVKDPNNDVSEVFADLSEVGGDRKSKMYDDGTHGDLIPSDRVYSVVFTVPKNVRPGRKSIEVTAKDSEGGVARTRV